ncbi:MAG: hypothetical protein FJ280_14980 [Planctomycetes bacterium]|nr:hypothetical protein [Planctomycetota bacterium]
MKYVVLSAVLLVAPAAGARDADDDWGESAGGFRALVGATWDSQYIWRGFDVFDGEDAVHVLADLNLFDTGFGVSVVGHQSPSEWLGALQRWDGTIYYQNGVFAGESYATNFRLGFVYYYYPKPNQGRTQDLMEGQVILSWPNLLPIPGLQPSYAFAYMFPGRENRWAQTRNPDFDDNSTGMFHILMLDYAFTVPAVLRALDDHVVKLHSELVYNGGVSPYGTPVNSGLSHAVLGASTDLALTAVPGLVLTPSFYYQFSFEDSVNPDNEFWASISLKYVF